MQKKKLFRWMRFPGMGMFLTGLFVPWFQLGFEPHPTPIQWSGMEDVLNSGSLGIASVLEDGFDLHSILLLLEFFSGVSLIFYLFHSISVAKKDRKGNKGISLFLIGISIIFLFNSQSPIIGKILFGFWLFVSGLILSAIVEWLSSIDFAAN